MKKKLIIACLFTELLVVSVSANITNCSNILQNRINKINSFYARFIQKIIETKSEIIQESKGELWISRPNLFNLHMIVPDESFLISDGKTIWFYNPFIEQVTANWLENTTSNTPLMLITLNNTINWHNYNINQKGNNFCIVPKFDNRKIKQYNINIMDNGLINSFSAMEQDGRCIVFYLKDQKKVKIDRNKFHFLLPKGVMLDDQR